jgi:hypothetical protein
MHHRYTAVKSLGFLIVLVGICSLVALHAFAAHLRDATASVGEDRAFSVALQALTTTPWRLADLSSYYLFGLGTLFGISSFWKGHSFDDPYPGYGAANRRMIAARDEYSDEHGLLFGDLEEIKEDTVQQLTEGIDRIPLFPQRAENIRIQRDALIEQFRAYEKSIETAANLLLQLYRDENRVNRATRPPAHFDNQWKLPYSFLETDRVIGLTRKTSSSPLDIDQCLQDLRELSRLLLREYESLIARYPHPSEMTSSP